jgi:pre-mRNA-processing factor 19
MLCAISGVAPEVPVASRKSGNVFEKRLIESYISENGTDPVNGEELAVEDLIDLKTNPVIAPRPPKFTSIPSLLSAFQNEWDALALETYTLKTQLSQTRQELSTALYQHDAAVRVIARLTRERNEARDALSKITVSTGGATTNGDAMQLDGNQALPDEAAAKVDATQERLSSTRRKRPVPPEWATGETIESLDVETSTSPLVPGGTTLALDTSTNIALVGGADGAAIAYSVSKQSEVERLNCGGSITGGLWWRGKAVVSSSNGSVKLFENGSELAQLGSHAGAATSVSLHPSGELLASTGVDKSYIIYDLIGMRIFTQIYTDSELTCGAFHPDGHLFAAGGTDGRVKLFDVKSGQNVANFDHNDPLLSLSFSENGTWLATVVKGSTTVSVWDLRKSSIIKILDIGSPVQRVKWDYTGQFLLASGPGCVAVQQYSKSSKAWSEPFRKAVNAVDIEWGSNATTILALGPDGSLHTLAATS